MNITSFNKTELYFNTFKDVIRNDGYFKGYIIMIE